VDTDRPHERYRSAPNNSFGVTYRDACDEALRRGDRKVGTEHLFLALLMDPECLEAVQHSLDDARAALEALDQADLLAVGIDARACQAPPLHGLGSHRLPLTPAAKDALKQSTREAGSRHFGPRHLLLALLRHEEPDGVACLLGRLEADRAGVRARLQGA